MTTAIGAPVFTHFGRLGRLVLAWMAGALHNAVAHPLMVVLPGRWGTWLHDATADLWDRQLLRLPVEMEVLKQELQELLGHIGGLRPDGLNEFANAALRELHDEGAVCMVDGSYVAASRGEA